MLSFTDKIRNIITNKQSVSLRFLSSYEQSQIQSIRNDSIIHFFGGYPESERKRAYFNMEPIDDISCFKIVYPNSHLTLTHQNILGTLLSLSITKDSIGDILPKQGVFFITTEIKEEIVQSFVAINRVPIELIEIDGNSVHSEQEYANFQLISDSLRLDLIVSKIAGCSRTQSVALVEKEMVKINQIIITKSTKQIQKDDVLSIRGYGRFVIDDTSQRTRKQKIVVKYRKFI